MPPGFEPGRKGFADLGLTTWLWHHQRNILYQKKIIYASIFNAFFIISKSKKLFLNSRDYNKNPYTRMTRYIKTIYINYRHRKIFAYDHIKRVVFLKTFRYNFPCTRQLARAFPCTKPLRPFPRLLCLYRQCSRLL